MNKKRAAKLLFIIALLMACALVLFGYVQKNQDRQLRNIRWRSSQNLQNRHFGNLYLQAQMQQEQNIM